MGGRCLSSSCVFVSKPVEQKLTPEVIDDVLRQLSAVAMAEGFWNWWPLLYLDFFVECFYFLKNKANCKKWNELAEFRGRFGT